MLILNTGFAQGTDVRNPILVNIPIQSRNSSMAELTAVVNNKTLNTVDSGEKEKGKTHVS
jgi:hypothetical protein